MHTKNYYWMSVGLSTLVLLLVFTATLIACVA